MDTIILTENQKRCLAKLQEYDAMFCNFFDWFIGQYDKKTGGFFHARSSFEMPNLHPDIESSTFAVDIMLRFGLLMSMPKWMKQAVIMFFRDLQDKETGFFYDKNPDMKKDEVMLARAQSFCVKSLSNLGAQPLYPLPAPAAAPDYMKTPEAMLEWMSQVELTNAWRGCDKMSSVRMFINRMEKQKAQEYLNAAWAYLEKTQDKQTGFWGSGRPLIRLSGTFKIIAGFYGQNHDKIPNKEIIYKSVLDAMRSDDAVDFCWVRNPIDIITSLGIKPTDDELLEIISITVENVRRLSRADGGFSREMEHSPSATNVAQVKPGDGHRDIPKPVYISKGLYESDMNAATQADSVRRMCYRLAGLPATNLEQYANKLKWPEEN